MIARRTGAALTALILAVSTLLGLAGCSPVWAGGPADPATTQKVKASIEGALARFGASGSIYDLTARHAGFSRGGMDVTFTYTETVKGERISIPVIPVEFPDDGSLGDSSDIRDAIIATQPHTHQPGYQELRTRYTDAVRDALPTSGRLEIDDYFFGFQDDPGHASRTGTDRDWFIATAEQNAVSDDPADRAFFGYYAIDPDEAFQHTFFQVAFKDDSPEVQAAWDGYAEDGCREINRILDADWKEASDKVALLDPTTAPNARYQVLLAYAEMYPDYSSPFQLGSPITPPATSSHLPADCRA